MPGLQKGKPHKPGAGRPALVRGERARRLTITLSREQEEALRAYGGGNLSAGVRRLYDEFFADPVEEDHG